MRVGIDGTCWANARGYGRFTRELCTAMVRLAPEDQFLFFADARAAERFELRDANSSLKIVDQSASPTEAAASDGSRSPADMLRLSRAVWREKLDVFFSPSVYTYFPLPPRLPAVVTIHDTIAERFPELTLPSRKARLFWKIKVKLALKQASRVLTVSNFSAREIHRVLKVPEDKIRVACEAPADSFCKNPSSTEISAAAAKVGLPGDARWFIYVGGFNPHKRVDLLVRAHAEVAKRATPPIYLLLVGTRSADVFHGDQARIIQAIEEAGTRHLVLWTGFLPDNELCPLHAGALALVLPSECEGFGLPAVEAAAAGAPVIATTESPLPELLAGGGIFVPPGDLAALTDAMRRMASETTDRKPLSAKAREGARALSWERGARAALEALKEVAS